MAANILTKLLLLTFLFGTSVSQANICSDRKTICQSFETCVSWERGCSLGANCLGPGIFEQFTECIKTPVKPPLLPKKFLCKNDEVFARSVDKRCAKPPCPLRLGFNCYPEGGAVPTCKGIRCPFGTFCVVGEYCNDLFCEPRATCRLSNI